MKHQWATNRNHNHKLKISTVPTKVKSQEPAYSKAIVQNKIDRQRVRSRVKQADSQTALVGGVWSWDGEGGREKRTPM